MKFLSCLSDPAPARAETRPLLDDGRPTVEGCIFCGVSREKGFNIVYEDEELIAFHDRWPQAEQHLLIIPRYHLASTVRDLNSAHIPLLNRMLSLATAVHASASPSLKSASRLNTGFHIPPFSSVSHLHLHVLSGKPTWLGRLKHPFSSSPALKPDRDREHQQQPPQPADTFVTAPPAQENGSSLARNPASSEARVNGIPHDQDGLVAPRDENATEKESTQKLGWGWYISGPHAIRILEHGGRIGLGPSVLSLPACTNTNGPFGIDSTAMWRSFSCCPRYKRLPCL